MKKLLMTAVALMLMGCLALSTALAVDVTIMKPSEGEGNEWRWVNDMIPVGEWAYFQVEEQSGASRILRWKPGVDEPEVYATELCNANYWDSMEQVEEQLASNSEIGIIGDIEHGITKLFADGERLMAVNHLNGKVFAITAQDGKAAFEDVATIQDMQVVYHVTEDYSYFVWPEKVLYVGEKLLWLCGDYDEALSQTVWRMWVFDMKDGSVSKASLNYPLDMTPYKDGKVLVRERVDRPDNQGYTWNVLVYDTATDKYEKVAELSDASSDWWSPSYFMYSEALDALIFNRDTRVMGLFNNFTEEKQVGYQPVRYSNTAALLGDSLMVYNGSDSGVMVRTLSKDFKTDEYINLFGSLATSTMTVFSEAHPQVPVYNVTTETWDAAGIDQMMKSGDSAPDVLEMYVSYDLFTRLVEKKGCADLSGYPSIVEYVNSLYPVYKEAVTGANGEIYAIPRLVNSYDGVFVNKTMMDEMGLTMEDIPTNLVDLCAFVTRWNDEFVEKFSNYAPLETDDYKSWVFYNMFEGYINYCQANKMDLKFDTPVFREMMAALEAMKVDEIQASLKNPNPEISEYKQGLISIGNHLVGNWTDYMTEESIRAFIPMSLTKDTECHIAVEMEVYFINPLSNHKDMAVELLETVINDLPERYTYTTVAGEKEPVKNDYYDEMIKNEEDYLARLEKNLETAAAEEKADLQTMIDAEKAWFERFKASSMYDISPAAIAWYEEQILPRVFVKTPSFMDASDGSSTEIFDSLIQQYKDGKIDLERFIREADGKLRMMQME